MTKATTATSVHIKLAFTLDALDLGRAVRLDPMKPTMNPRGAYT